MSCSLHDAARFEALGLPTAVIATDAFVRSADEQLEALNFVGYRPYLLFIPHPLASLDRAAVERKADAALADVMRSLLGGSPVPGTAPPNGSARGEPASIDDPLLAYKPVAFRPVGLSEAVGGMSAPARGEEDGDAACDDT